VEEVPLHRDTFDGPVVTAAQNALEEGDVDVVLPFVPERDEAEVRGVFDRVVLVRGANELVSDVADRLFVETVVRVHWGGGVEPGTGVRTAGLDIGPAIPLAEISIDTGSSAPVAEYLTRVLQEELKRRLDQVNGLGVARNDSVAAGRAWVTAMLGFQAYSHAVLTALHAPGSVTA
jgi:hypothetical protein